MSNRDDTPFTCVTCEIEIAGPVTFHVGLPFCCAGCVANGPCTCSYDDLGAEASTVADGSAVRHCLDIETAMGNGAFEPAAEAVATRR